MERREFLFNARKRIASENKLLNADIPVNYSLEKYSGNFDKTAVSHLLRRCLFSYTDTQHSKALEDGLDATIQNLLTDDEPMPAPPVKFYTNNPAQQGEYDDGLQIGDTFIDADLNFQHEQFRTYGVMSWWTDNIHKQGFSLREKMVLFWHNHFATQLDVVRIGRFQYETNKLYRDFAIGNFKDLVTKVTHDQTMMLFLNGNENVAGRPNENYARELFELFTVGKGPQIAPGNYTTYTEEDIRECAKVLTGWNFDFRGIRTGNYDVVFLSQLHDYSTKKFSSAFGNKVIQPTGEGEYYDLINMIFQQDEAAKYIIRKLYRWFVYYEIDSEVETNIIEPLAEIFKQNNFEVRPVLEKLLSSEHFFDKAFRGAMIKNPIDFLANVVRPVGYEFDTGRAPGLDPITIKYYSYGTNYYQKALEYGMELGNPPSVAGWEAYYQTPGYQRIWISSVTLPGRIKLTSEIYTAQGVRGNFGMKASGLDMVKDYENASDPVALVNYMAEKMLSLELTEEFKAELKGYLVSEGQGDYIWTQSWYAYEQDPDNIVFKLGVETKINNLMIAISQLSEYQLM